MVVATYTINDKRKSRSTSPARTTWPARTSWSRKDNTTITKGPTTSTARRSAR